MPDGKAESNGVPADGDTSDKEMTTPSSHNEHREVFKSSFGLTTEGQSHVSTDILIKLYKIRIFPAIIA